LSTSQSNQSSTSQRTFAHISFHADIPEISRFFGIVIAMYYNDHEPPHFHARYGSQRAKILIDPPTLVAGELTPRALGMVMEWAALHRDELRENFNATMEHRPTRKIDPLS
jgi:hypothetical protein